MFDAIAPRYELVNKLMTLGLDTRWRRRAVADLRLARNSVVLDVAAGTGDFARELQRQHHRAVGTDLSYNMLHLARNVPERVQADASSLPFRAAIFDGITCGYALRNFTDLQATFEVAEPTGGPWRAGFRFWFRKVVPFIGSLLSDRDAYHYLPASTAYLPTAREITSMLNRAGFSAVNNRRVMGGLSQQFLATRTS
jgi:demethylmenaquinone methyltransferase / 2-methoxy-6-polyprenyl-1,4-benzoquinol methylase